MTDLRLYYFRASEHEEVVIRSNGLHWVFIFVQVVEVRLHFVQVNLARVHFRPSEAHEIWIFFVQVTDPVFSSKWVFPFPPPSLETADIASTYRK